MNLAFCSLFVPGYLFYKHNIEQGRKMQFQMQHSQETDNILN